MLNIKSVELKHGQNASANDKFDDNVKAAETHSNSNDDSNRNPQNIFFLRILLLIMVGSLMDWVVRMDRWIV